MGRPSETRYTSWHPFSFAFRPSHCRCVRRSTTRRRDQLLNYFAMSLEFTDRVLGRYLSDNPTGVRAGPRWALPHKCLAFSWKKLRTPVNRRSQTGRRPVWALGRRMRLLHATLGLPFVFQSFKATALAFALAALLSVRLLHCGYALPLRVLPAAWMEDGP